ncbi:MAG: winged helix-turn-helix transcriptional regulator [Alphaproteobacteria bacterium]|nr:winged helix-turn-helix transcriptional regulator [Alphaproteobacteria bacterium]MBT7942744.1 winged helix-turn-helix transcriptional regulator [Alphaproteobacteria bacterium]
MVKYNDQALDATFHALADPTRRAILARLSQGQVSVGELAAPFEMSLPAVSKHLKVLEGADLITRHRDGRVSRMEFNPTALMGAVGWITYYKNFWDSRLDRLARFLDETKPTDEDNNGSSTKD